jgi:3-oxoacyl-[acyl-carrier protein] reductase
VSVPHSDGPDGVAGRVAVVSGASSGIGAATAKLLLAQGYATVLGLSRRGNPQLAGTAGYLDLVADLRDRDQLRKALSSAEDATAEGVHAVVLNAGVSPAAYELADVPWEAAAAVYETNVCTALHLVQETLPLLRRAGGGSLVFVGASLANGYTAERWPYAASKSAMTALMRSCSTAFASDGVVANEVRPGPVATPMTLGAAGDEVSEDVLRVINQGYGTDWLKPARLVAGWIAELAAFPSNGPTGQIFNYSRRVL